jgi:hypothetical protein
VLEALDAVTHRKLPSLSLRPRFKPLLGSLVRVRWQGYNSYSGRENSERAALPAQGEPETEVLRTMYAPTRLPHNLTADEQYRKLKLAFDIAREVWK